MIYQYVACNETGEIAKGKLSAASEEAATEVLSYAGYRAISIKPFVPFFSTGRLAARSSRVNPTEIILFFRQMALLLESGINITTSLELLQAQTTIHSLKRTLGEVISDLRRGNQLSASLSKHPEIFSPICCQSLSIGEQTGGLETMLRQMADYMEKSAIATKSIKSALMYPIIAAIITAVVVGILAFFVLPAFSDLYSSVGAELPALTRIVLDVSSMLRDNVTYILLALIAVAGLAIAYTRTPEGRYKLDKLALSLPLMGHVNHLNWLANCCRSISLLFRAGLPLTEIMPLVAHGTSNKLLAKALIDVHQDMLRGEGLSQPMAKNNLFLPMMVQMVKVGEETGNLDVTLLAVAQSYETDAEDKTRSLIGLIQPAMTLIIGLVVGVIALSLVSAMYSIYGQGL